MRTLLALLLLSASPLLSLGQPKETNTSKIVRLDYPDSMRSLLQNISGKVVYLDIFASQCQPCRAEITHYPALQDFFTDNDIVCLFASVDSDKAGCDQCVELLNEAGLQGYFVTYFAPEGRTAGQFANELGALFCDTDQAGKIVRISVPRYIIFDRQGKIAERHAKRPSNGEELKKELSGYLR